MGGNDVKKKKLLINLLIIAVGPAMTVVQYAKGKSGDTSGILFLVLGTSILAAVTAAVSILTHFRVKRFWVATGVSTIASEVLYVLIVVVAFAYFMPDGCTWAESIGWLLIAIMSLIPGAFPTALFVSYGVGRIIGDNQAGRGIRVRCMETTRLAKLVKFITAVVVLLVVLLLLSIPRCRSQWRWGQPDFNEAKWKELRVIYMVPQGTGDCVRAQAWSTTDVDQLARLRQSMCVQKATWAGKPGGTRENRLDLKLSNGQRWVMWFHQKTLMGAYDPYAASTWWDLHVTPEFYETLERTIKEATGVAVDISSYYNDNDLTEVIVGPDAYDYGEVLDGHPMPN